MSEAAKKAIEEENVWKSQEAALEGKE